MKVTSKDIAEICGVSRGTVDRALNNRSEVNPETREKILRVAQQLGYRPNFAAKSLVTGQTMTIGLILFDVNNRLFAQFVNSIESEARNRGYLVNLLLSDANPSTELECINHLIDRRTDGIIMLPVNKTRVLEEVFSNAGVPVATFGNKLSSSNFPFISIDDKQAMKEGTEYVLSKGYEELIYVSPPLAIVDKVNAYAQEMRYRGFEEACKGREDIACHVVQTKTYLKSVESILSKTKATKAKPAIICSTDMYAVELVHRFTAHGIRVPQDVGVMGFDNIDLLNYIHPGISTVDFPIGDIAVKAMDVMFDLINGGNAPEQVVFPHKIVARQSL